MASDTEHKAAKNRSAYLIQRRNRLARQRAAEDEGPESGSVETDQDDLMGVVAIDYQPPVLFEHTHKAKLRRPMTPAEKIKARIREAVDDFMRRQE